MVFNQTALCVRSHSRRASSISTMPRIWATNDSVGTLKASGPRTASAGQSLAEVVVTISPSAVVDTPATKNIVVELFQPDLTGVGTMFYGSNATGTGVTYIRAPGCGAAEPVDLLSLGAFPNVKIIASLAGAGLPVELQDYKVD